MSLNLMHEWWITPNRFNLPLPDELCIIKLKNPPNPKLPIAFAKVIFAFDGWGDQFPLHWVIMKTDLNNPTGFIKDTTWRHIDLDDIDGWIRVVPVTIEKEEEDGQNLED